MQLLKHLHASNNDDQIQCASFLDFDIVIAWPIF